MEANNKFLSFSGKMERKAFVKNTLINLGILGLGYGAMFLSLISTRDAGTQSGSEIGLFLLNNNLSTLPVFLVCALFVFVLVAHLSSSVRRMRDMLDTDKVLGSPLSIVLLISLIVPHINTLTLLLLLFIRRFNLFKKSERVESL